MALETSHQGLEQFLCARLTDPDPKTQRAAIIALGKLGRGLDALLALWDAGVAIEQRRALANSFGKTGDSRALERLQTFKSDDPELSRIRNEALLKLERTLCRPSAGRVDLDATPPGPTAALLYCRRGLESFVQAELTGGLEPRIVGAGRVAATLRGSLRSLLSARTALGFGFPLATVAPTQNPSELAVAVAQAIAAERGFQLMAALTRGGLRYRIEWASAGRRRALTQRVAERVSRLRPELVNDPRAAAWQIVVAEGRHRVELELRPHQLDDPRFAYRKRLLPAASHPTIAAALAHVAGARADDVVWDPFVGSATELIERARLGPYRKLYGSDIDPDALEAGRDNLRAAGVDAELAIGDARTHQLPERPTLLLTNPPLGRRLLNSTSVADLLARTLERAAELLPETGRLVWVSPAPALTVSRAARAGLKIELRQRIDMGGFDAEIQCFVRAHASARDAGTGTRR
jgi:23S rRNA G2445 N2-methylase RlmL